MLYEVITMAGHMGSPDGPAIEVTLYTPAKAKGLKSSLVKNYAACPGITFEASYNLV